MKFLGVLVFTACIIAAQSTPTPTPAPAAPVQAAPVAPIVKQQFGPSFTVATTLPKSILAADFDGDGVEDLVIVADSKDPLPDSYEYKYHVADPYNAFFGYGDPRHTANMSHYDPGHTHALLVIFGAGAEAWRAATPKAKFVLINVPFDTVELGRILIKKNKPPVFVIKAQESRLMDSAVFWDAKKKKWRWQPGDPLE